MTYTAVAEGVEPAAPVGVAGLYHRSMVSTEVVLLTITPYTEPAMTNLPL
jgi:hypothetical protein